MKEILEITLYQTEKIVEGDSVPDRENFRGYSIPNRENY